jgi:DNA-binding transcriptional ArsR family regulator
MAMDEDRIFKALSDPTRRQLLDLLFQTEGMTLNALTSHLSMSRFGCMKHLDVLEEAGLITSRKQGRERLHFLNPMPIQHVYERWVSKYAQPWSAMLSAVQQTFEGTAMTQDFVLETYIRTSRDALWKAITDGKVTPKLLFWGATGSRP